MNPIRSESINGHEIDEFVWGRGVVVYVDFQRWDASFEGACAWAKRHAESWRCPVPTPGTTDSSSGEKG
jgi:hypothetical protein